MTRIAVVGGGRIGEALVSGLLAGGRQARDLVITERFEARGRELASEYGIRVTQSIADAAEGAAVLVVAVKPNDVDSVLAEVAEYQETSDDDQLIVSLAAGITTARFEQLLPAGTAVVRVMPNTPMLVGQGASAITPGRHATAVHMDLVEELMGAVGMVRRVKESSMDAVTAVSGSGPAYFFLAIEAMVDSGVALGLTRPVARDLAIQTLVGAGAMLAESGETATELRAAVMSPGGTTAAAIRQFEKDGLRSAFFEAMAVVRDRSAALGAVQEDGS
ncbi:pyrroline-5-carboxylate reductase [Tomitella gaofuii]|uniref:pyrroline-5-carboxylate reductase n=1 Tax=Tomitella gaofuii TaxID=2760083 RepID=UPI0015FBD219|nr:pyrroline-5-carboxylate reductase [Tomitella gaofuii]